METLIRPFECSLHFFFLPMGSGRVLVVKGKQRYGDKREGGERGCHKMLLEIIKLPSNYGGNIFFFPGVLSVLEIQDTVQQTHRLLC